jgi:hypothetical protein
MRFSGRPAPRQGILQSIVAPEEFSIIDDKGRRAEDLHLLRRGGPLAQLLLERLIIECSDARSGIDTQP